MLSSIPGRSVKPILFFQLVFALTFGIWSGLQRIIEENKKPFLFPHPQHCDLLCIEYF